MQSYGRLIGLIWPHRWVSLGALLSSAILAATQGGYAWLLGPVLRFVYDTDPSERLRGVIPVSLSEATESAGGVATLLAAAVLIVSFIRAFAQFGSQYLTALAGQRVVRSLRANLYAHVLRLPLAYFRRQQTGDLVTRVTADTGELQVAVTTGVSTLAQQVLQVVLLSALALSMDPVLGLLALVALPALAVLLRRAGNRVRRLQTDAWDAQGEVASLVANTAAAAAVIKAFTAEDAVARRFAEQDARFFRDMLAAVRTRAMTSPISEVLGACALGLTLWYANARVTSGALPPEDFVSFFASVFLMYRPARAIVDTHAWVMAGVGALDRIEAVLQEPPEPADPASAATLNGIEREIRLEDVWFAYPEAPDRDVLRGVDLVLRRGERVALVGATGAGKSTIVSLLLRFYGPTRGRLSVDGVGLAELSRRSWRGTCALVTQEPILLRDSVLGNVSCAEPTPDRARVEAAVKAAGLADVVASLPGGLDTDVGEAGARFSGGEKQRVCLARAFYRDAPLLVLDEATSSLDAESERDLHDALTGLMAGRTVLLVSHRLSSVRYADRVVVLQDGQIVEEGRPDELWARRGPYHRLFRGQASPTEGASVLQT